MPEHEYASNEDVIDAEVVNVTPPTEQTALATTQQTALPAESPENAVQAQQGTAVFNPLDANPMHFKQALAQRQENYDALREHLREILVPEKDFGKIHVAKNCDNKYNCDNPYHFSGYELFDPGADKILGLLGLGVKYDDDVLTDYRRAALKGMKIEHVILTAYVISGAQQVVAEGSGVCSLSERSDNFHNAMMIAQKRARVGAVKRLPGVSALFDGDFFASVVPKDRPKPHSAPSRTDRDHGAQPVGPGKLIEKMPFGMHKGTPFTQLPDEYLSYIADKIRDKPDIHHSAVTEINRRKLQDNQVKTTTAERGQDEPPINQSHSTPPNQPGDVDDLPPVDIY